MTPVTGVVGPQWPERVFFTRTMPTATTIVADAHVTDRANDAPLLRATK